MALCGKVHHPVYFIFCKNLCDGVLVCDVCLDKCIVFPVLDFLQILEISSICQRIYVDNPDLVVIFAKHIVNII